MTYVIPTNWTIRIIPHCENSKKRSWLRICYWSHVINGDWKNFTYLHIIYTYIFVVITRGFDVTHRIILDLVVAFVRVIVAARLFLLLAWQHPLFACQHLSDNVIYQSWTLFLGHKCTHMCITRHTRIIASIQHTWHWTSLTIHTRLHIETRDAELLVWQDCHGTRALEHEPSSSFLVMYLVRVQRSVIGQIWVWA